MAELSLSAAESNARDGGKTFEVMVEGVSKRSETAFWPYTAKTRWWSLIVRIIVSVILSMYEVLKPSSYIERRRGVLMGEKRRIFREELAI